MRVAWATPLAESSAIGRFSVGVTNELARYCACVDIFRTERKPMLDERSLPTALRVFKLADLSSYNILNDKYDVVVYNFGNHDIYHHYAVDAAKYARGVCIFHDVHYLNLFWCWMHAKQRVAEIPSLLTEICGVDAAAAVAQIQSGHVPGDHEKPLMLEWLAPYANGAVAHGRHYLERLARSCPGPVRHIPLAYNLTGAIPPATSQDPSRLRLVTIGYVNDNKRAAEIIRCIAASGRLKAACEYRLAGSASAEKRASLEKLARSLGVEFHITGTLSRDELLAEIAKADALLCVRKPVLEGASASAIEAMLSGRPAVVMDHGFYSELPDELVLKVRPDFEQADVTQRLLWLLDNPAERRTIGERAAVWAAEQFSFTRYAQEIRTLIDRAVEAEPAIRLGVQLGKEMAAIGVKPDDPATDRISQVASGLFCRGLALGLTASVPEGVEVDIRMDIATRCGMRGVPATESKTQQASADEAAVGLSQAVFFITNGLNGMRRVLREFARPFERLGKSVRRRFGTLFLDRQRHKG